ncbi:basic salivary proline-rich protein 2-like [Sphaerodactylus townsendi]|uniref:basic salivary proline-rich protein 2-like n=1 Tax=Sphaerodactylus townsendi TaxID=933632 RepID=UPI002026EE27|nr:basic salivary proline-rich protein 2-like [Sphaerodactylus townsendi]
MRARPAGSSPGWAGAEEQPGCREGAGPPRTCLSLYSSPPTGQPPLPSRGSPGAPGVWRSEARRVPPASSGTCLAPEAAPATAQPSPPLPRPRPLRRCPARRACRLPSPPDTARGHRRDRQDRAPPSAAAAKTGRNPRALGWRGELPPAPPLRPPPPFSRYLRQGTPLPRTDGPKGSSRPGVCGGRGGSGAAAPAGRPTLLPGRVRFLKRSPSALALSWAPPASGGPGRAGYSKPPPGRQARCKPAGRAAGARWRFTLGGGGATASLGGAWLDSRPAGSGGGGGEEAAVGLPPPAHSSPRSFAPVPPAEPRPPPRAGRATCCSRRGQCQVRSTTFPAAALSLEPPPGLEAGAEHQTPPPPGSAKPPLPPGLQSFSLGGGLGSCPSGEEWRGLCSQGGGRRSCPGPAAGDQPGPTGPPLCQSPGPWRGEGQALRGN